MWGTPTQNMNQCLGHRECCVENIKFLGDRVLGTVEEQKKSPSASLRTVTLVWSVVVWAGTQTNLPGCPAMSLLF